MSPKVLGQLANFNRWRPVVSDIQVLKQVLMLIKLKLKLKASHLRLGVTVVLAYVLLSAYVIRPYLQLPASLTIDMDLQLPTPSCFPTFPYDAPYDIQLDLMRHLYTSIEQRKVTVVESPTGTVSTTSSGVDSRHMLTRINRAKR